MRHSKEAQAYSNLILSRSISLADVMDRVDSTMTVLIITGHQFRCDLHMSYLCQVLWCDGSSWERRVRDRYGRHCVFFGKQVCWRGRVQKLETLLKVRQSRVALPRLFAEYQVAQSQNVTDTEGNDIHILWNEHLMSTCTGTLQFHASLVLHYIYIHINCHDWILSHLWNALLCGGAGWGPMSQSIYIRIKVCPTSCTDKTWTTFAYFCILLHHAGPCERF